MTINRKTPELLVPVQDWKSLKFIKNIADAIYFGIDKYNMRLKAENFKYNDLHKLVEYCHSQDPIIKTYLCTNILIYNSELKDLENLIREAKDADIDAVIAHDIAAINLAKRYNLDFHVSTQANISNIESAKFYENLGAKRIVLARELSLKQIKRIKKCLKKSKVECFIHGSMCTSISGRCYLSATICDSIEYSANRGKCVQPCRREWTMIDDENHEILYDGKLFLNAKDLCMIEYIPELIDANIDAFKIEGRMKSPLYVKTVAKCYKEAIDSYFDGIYTKQKVEKWIKRLSIVYNRGFHTGFYFRKPTIEEIELNKRGNISPYKKQYIGKVLSYNENTKKTCILIENTNILIEEGNTLIIIGKDTYSTDIIKEISINKNNIHSIIRKKEDRPIEVNILLKKKVKINDRIYKGLNID